MAVATDELLEGVTGQFSLDDIAGIADLIENEYIKPNDEKVTLYVNDTLVPLNVFPRSVFGGVLAAMASSLRGVGEIRTLKFFLRRGK